MAYPEGLLDDEEEEHPGTAHEEPVDRRDRQHQQGARREGEAEHRDGVAHQVEDEGPPRAEALREEAEADLSGDAARREQPEGERSDGEARALVAEVDHHVRQDGGVGEAAEADRHRDHVEAAGAQRAPRRPVLFFSLRRRRVLRPGRVGPGRGAQGTLPHHEEGVEGDAEAGQADRDVRITPGAEREDQRGRRRDHEPAEVGARVRDPHHATAGAPEPQADETPGGQNGGARERHELEEAQRVPVPELAHEGSEHEARAHRQQRPDHDGTGPVAVHQASEHRRGQRAERGEGQRRADLGAGPAEGLLQGLDEVAERVLRRADRDRHREERGGGGEPAADRVPRAGRGQSRCAKGSIPSLLRRISSRVRPCSSWGKTSQRSVS